MCPDKMAVWSGCCPIICLLFLLCLTAGQESLTTEPDQRISSVFSEVADLRSVVGLLVRDVESLNSTVIGKLELLDSRFDQLTNISSQAPVQLAQLTRQLDNQLNETVATLTR